MLPPGRGHGDRWCAENYPNRSYYCGSELAALARNVERYRRSDEFRSLEDPRVVIMTDEKEVRRLRAMQRRGWKLMPCLTAKCVGGNVGKYAAAPAADSGASPPISPIEQLVAEMAVAAESRKSVLNFASTFQCVIRRLHFRGEDGVAWLLKDPPS